MFFQDGPTFDLDAGSTADVLGRYRNCMPAAIVASYGAGTVGLVGPHPEADRSWYTGGLSNPDGVRFDLGYDLIDKTVSHPAR